MRESRGNPFNVDPMAWRVDEGLRKTMLFERKFCELKDIVISKHWLFI